MAKILIIIGLLAATIAAPFLLRPGESAGLVAAGDVERLIIISPHNESIQAEFTIGFVRYMKERFERDVYIDWRQPGGTTEIAMFLKSEYANAFENLWRRETGLDFTVPIRDAFTNNKLDSEISTDGTLYNQKLYRVQFDTVPGTIEEARLLSREMFLRSNVGVGIDLFFGGGAYDFSKQAAAGALVATDSTGKFGPEALNREHPDWFSESVMPAVVSGEPFRDDAFRWVGAVLSSFGLCYNKDVFARLGVEAPDQWEDLADPKLFGQIALADPTKSGSATKAYEMLIQQRIQQVLHSMQMQARDIVDIEADAVSIGWEEAIRMILKISANGRYFTDSATKVPQDVAQGEAGAGMCIDFYGRTFNEIKKREDGSSRIEFVMPENGTSIGADPIGLLRGAPNPELAHRFIEFVLSTAGQKLWNYRPGTPGGPVRSALRRPPIRKDFYTPENIVYMTDGEVNPYEQSKDFIYEGKWTGAAFNALRFAIRCACVDTHIEQREAWHSLIEAGMPPVALAEFEEVSVINYEQITGPISETLKSKDKIREVALARDLSGHFREKYRKVIELCGAENN
ncbi:MAG: extracellular solute-binding protein [Verrucomicrobiales bacterium]|nr:extracellular solute-binding protein [Verrucomicrobiales bacterium]